MDLLCTNEGNHFVRDLVPTFSFNSHGNAYLEYSKGVDFASSLICIHLHLYEFIYEALKD